MNEDLSQPMGRAKGAAARAAKLTPEERSAIARKAHSQSRLKGRTPTLAAHFRKP